MAVIENCLFRHILQENTDKKKNPTLKKINVEIDDVEIFNKIYLI